MNAILTQLTYPTHLTGFATFPIALKYSFIPKMAMMANAISTIYLFPINKIIRTNGNPNNPEVILFQSMFLFIKNIC